MKKKLHPIANDHKLRIPPLLTAFGLAIISSSHAAEVLLITTNSTNSQHLNDLLTNAGHTVTENNGAAGSSAASASDLVIITREINSGNFSDETVAQGWNGLNIPIINMTGFVGRPSRLGWFDSTNLNGVGGGGATDSFDVPYPLPSHPIVSGLTAPTETFASVALASHYPLVTELLTGSQVIATIDAGARASIITMPTGTTMANNRGTAGAPRFYWSFAGNGTYSSLNSNGEQIFLNMVNVALAPPADADNDGMLDDYEFLNGTDPNTNDAALDLDTDGLTNLQEHDGLDANGVSHGFGQTLSGDEDSDGDGIFDNAEISGSGNLFAPGTATNPNSDDSDDDGIDDGEEVNGTLNVANSNEATNPNSNDTDGDTMDDLYEVSNNLLGGLDPNTDDAAGNLDLAAEMADGNTFFLTNLQEYTGSENEGAIQTRADKGDTDDDGAPDHAEDNFGSWSDEFSLTGTNPAVADTDNDGILDGYENPTSGTFPLVGTPSATNQTLSDPNLPDSDGDGLLDGDEALTYQTNPGAPDTDNDGTNDAGEQHIYGTDPTDGTDSPSAAQLAELRVNFQRTGDATVLPDFQLYQADHEDGGVSWTEMTYSAFGGTDNITVGISWNAGLGVSPERPQMFQNRVPSSGAPLEWPALLADWAGTDNRLEFGEGMTVTVSGLPAGNYLWTSLHLDGQDRTDSFDASVTNSDGSVSGPTLVDGITSGNGGATHFDDVTQYQQTFTSNGSDPVEVYFENNGAFFFMNAFLITNTNLPVTGDGPVITSCEIEAGSGDFLITFSPGGTGFILTSSDDLESAFTEETSATLENGDTTFRIPATSLNAGKDFFRVEEVTN